MPTPAVPLPEPTIKDGIVLPIPTTSNVFLPVGAALVPIPTVAVAVDPMPTTIDGDVVPKPTTSKVLPVGASVVPIPTPAVALPVPITSDGAVEPIPTTSKVFLPVGAVEVPIPTVAVVVVVPIPTTIDGDVAPAAVPYTSKVLDSGGTLVPKPILLSMF